MKMNNSAEVERAKAWLKANGHKGPSSHSHQVEKSEPSLVDKFANHTFLMLTSNGPVVCVGLQESLTYEQAEKIASVLRGRCLSPSGAAGGNSACQDGIKIDLGAWGEISKCPVQSKTSSSFPGLRFNATATGFYLICSPADACQTFDQGKFQLEFSAAQPSATRTLGEIFNLIWRRGVCDKDIKETSPGKITNVYVTTQ
jgi:hypothetical protein